jgi:hypothetical protein
MHYVIRRVSPMGAMLYGLLIGFALWLIPGLLLGLFVGSAIAGLQDWLRDLQLLVLLPIGDGIPLDFTLILPVSGLQERLTALSGQENLLMLAIVLGTAAAGMLLTGMATLLGAILFNMLTPLFGGIGVTLDAIDTGATRRPVVDSAKPAPVVTTSSAPLVRKTQPDALPNRPQAPTAWLVSLAGHNERLSLSGDITRIGSASGNDIILAGLAANHAEIRRESGRYLIYDLGSRRTWVNDVQVAAVHMLKDGFRLQLGSSGFVFQVQSTQSQ